ncbi:MAG: hypothetical protein ABSG38_19335 [Spirochaetia bacterium]|jgi:hypothetical protein
MKALLLGAEHNLDLVALARIPLGGKLSLSYRREPDYFAGLEPAGEDTDVIGLYHGDVLTGACARSWKKLWIDGRVTRVGYLGGLRLSPEHQRRMYLPAGYRLLREIDKDKPGCLYLCTFLSRGGNSMQIMTRPRPGLLRFHSWGAYHAYSLLAPRHSSRVRFPAVNRARREEVPELLEFLNREGRKKQFFPVLEARDFTDGSLRSLNGSAWYLWAPGGKIRAAAAVWDQTPCRQVVVEKYPQSLRLTLPLVNGCLRLIRRQSLPNEGEQLALRYLAFATAEDNDPSALARVVRAALADLGGTDARVLSIGFADADPLKDSVRGLVKARYESRIFLAHWDGGEPTLPERNRIPSLELASL